MSKNPLARSSVYCIEKYVPGQSIIDKNDAMTVHKLSANENPYGCSPSITNHLTVNGGINCARYPDGNAETLRRTIAQKYRLSYDNIVCTNGSDEMFSLLCYAYLQQDDEVIYSQYGYLMYRIVTLAAGGRPIEVPAKDFMIDYDKIIKAITDKTKIIFITNPNNPTGIYTDKKTLETFISSVPSHVIVVLDAAYAEYVTEQDYTEGHCFVETYRNVVITRTFSKIHGLAAFRLGWGYASEQIIEVMNRMRAPFNVSAIAQSCGLLAINDDMFIKESQRKNHEWRKTTVQQLEKMGIRVLPSQTNFLLLFFSSVEQCLKADEGLKSQGIILRYMKAYGLPQCLRYSCGSEKANKIVLNCLGHFMKEYKNT